MDKIDLFLGFIIGILASFVGSFLFITLFTSFDFISGIHAYKTEGHLGKIITLGSLLDLIAFGILLKINKELMARGVVMAVIVITLFTLLV